MLPFWWTAVLVTSPIFGEKTLQIVFLRVSSRTETWFHVRKLQCTSIFLWCSCKSIVFLGKKTQPNRTAFKRQWSKRPPFNLLRYDKLCLINDHCSSIEQCLDCSTRPMAAAIDRSIDRWLWIQTFINMEQSTTSTTTTTLPSSSCRRFTFICVWGGGSCLKQFDTSDERKVLIRNKCSKHQRFLLSKNRKRSTADRRQTIILFISIS